MSFSGILVNQILIIFIIILIGVICYKTKLIDDTTNSKLSNILLMLVNPIVIFVSYQRDFSKELLEGLLISLLMSFAVHIVGILASYILIRKKRKQVIVLDKIRIKKYVDAENVEVERFAAIYANVGFMGIPLVNGIFGSEGVFYVTAAFTVFHILSWTHGVMMMSGEKNLNFKDFLKKLINPTIIGIAVGLICFIFQIRVPDVVYQALSHIANLNTPFAMLIAGVTIGKSNIVKLFTKNLRIYYISLIRLLVVPLISVMMFFWLPINETVKITAILMSAVPTAAIGTLFAIKFNKNAVLAAEIFAVTTLLSIVTVPVIIKIAEMLI